MPSFRQVSFFQGYRLCIKKLCVRIILSKTNSVHIDSDTFKYLYRKPPSWNLCNNIWCHPYKRASGPLVCSSTAVSTGITIPPTKRSCIHTLLFSHIEPECVRECNRIYRYIITMITGTTGGLTRESRTLPYILHFLIAYRGIPVISSHGHFAT